MAAELFGTAQELESRGEPFAIATVIGIQGSGSAKPGSKAVVDSSGRVMLGWIGGGCAESTVCQEALDSMRDGKVRVITLDLTDEIFGMPCGGMMQVYIEPVLPKPDLVIAGHGQIAEVLAQMGHLLGFSVTVADPAASPEAFPTANHIFTSGLSSSEVHIRANSYVVVATHHKGDQFAIKKAIDAQASYIALIASRTRSQLVFEYLEAAGVVAEESAKGKVRAPAGLDIGAQTPEEIALSIMSEIVAVRRGGSGRSMMEAAASRHETHFDKSAQVLSARNAPMANSENKAQ
ncbi:MAG TPA: XdhC family protein [Chthoniobacterales bacterium]|nr:XdhC family protein [Chthoniobacterales bacterium]